MLKKIGTVVVVCVLIGSFGACKKKEENPQMPAGHPTMEGGMPSAGMPKVERKVVVSKEVKAQWKAVKLAVENKATKKTKEYTITIGTELAIPDSKMTVRVLNFLPDFKMSNTEIYSASVKPNMPAAQIVVTDSGKEIFNNWLFSLQPTIHAFQDPNGKIGIMLLSGASK